MSTSQLNLDENRAQYQIRGYKPGIIKINDQTFIKSIIIGPEKLIEDWPPQEVSELTRTHLEVILAIHPAILLIGTGSTLKFPSVEIYGDLINHGIGVEIMDTSAACRTYNALTSEGRNVMAALLVK